MEKNEAQRNEIISLMYQSQKVAELEFFFRPT